MEKENKKKSFHLTITDNETGKTLHDGDALAIIAGVCTEETAFGLTAAKCGADDYVSALIRAEEEVEGVYEEHPELLILATLFKCEAKQSEEPETEETEETENNQ